MATTEAQHKWREKNKDVKSQLNVMARKITHDGLSSISDEFGLRGKAEAVAFCAFVVKSMQQKGQRDAATFLYLDALKAGFKRDRETYAP